MGKVFIILISADYMLTDKYVWINGKFKEYSKTRLPLLTHALHYGTAIFEGIRAYETNNGLAVFRIQDHFKRFVDGAKSYGFELDYSEDELVDATLRLLKKNKSKSCYIRPLIYVSTEGIGLDIVGAEFTTMIISLPFGKYFGNKFKTGIRCKVSSYRRMNKDFLSPHVKASANYLTSALAKKEARLCGFDEAIMLNHEGKVAEGSGENIFVVRDNILYTPPDNEDILRGITRSSIIDLAFDLGYGVMEKPLYKEDLFTADEVFLTGTAAEVTPVIEVDGKKIGTGKPGKVTKKLQKEFMSIVSGKNKAHMDWLTFVR